jgi:hypothetical protein
MPGAATLGKSMVDLMECQLVDLLENLSAVQKEENWVYLMALK